MSPWSSTESYPAFARIGLKENPGKNLNQSRAVASRSKASCLGLALRNARWFESSWEKKFSHEISVGVWDRCPPSIVMHLGSYDRRIPFRHRCGVLRTTAVPADLDFRRLRSSVVGKIPTKVMNYLHAVLIRSTGFLNMCSHNVVSTGCSKSPLCILCYFKMNDVIDNPADCEVRSVIRFLNARHLKPAEIYRQLKEVYGDTVMNERNVRKWCEMFNNGRTNVHDETRPGRPSLITEDLKTKVNDRILQDRRTSLDELHIAFPDISRSLLGEIMSQHLGYHKICARWVPRQLSDQHKTQRMASALTFLMRYHTDGDAFLDQIMTGDETWVSHNTPETKRQSRQWHHPSSPKKPRKFKQSLSTRLLTLGSQRCFEEDSEHLA
ncbi:hypothetical protein ANN_06032 [Periplaneta americana]|uniref:Mos1 transposase HTH domain-containing protein n=1 Tax=Periplaneta americana TaxID=6978 RepID=A0ABQ8TE45_PERAM|nr:hypothetical protein ANN_06032 [Periplaneta americana]